MRLIASILGTLAVAAMVSSGAKAETDWPTGPVTIVVPFSPGGGMDQTLLPLKPLLEERLDQTVLFDYKPGASSQIATEFVHATGQDGSLILGMSLPHFPNTTIFSDPAYTIEDFAPVGIITSDVPIWFAHKDSPYNDINDLIEAARENPGGVSIAIGSFTGEHYVTVALLEQEADVEFNVVNVKGGAKVMSNVAGKHFDVGVSRPGSILPVQDEIKGLGLVATERNPLYPDTKTFDEQLDGIEIPHLRSARGLAVHKAFAESDPEAFTKLVDALESSVHTDTYRKQLNDMGLELTWEGPDQAAETIALMRDAMDEYQVLIEAAKTR